MKKRYLLLALPLLMAFRPGTFEPETFNWSPPTEYTDGRPLPANELLGNKLDCASDKGGVVKRSIPGGATQVWDVPEGTFNAGTWNCTLVATAGADSEPSLPVEFVVANFTFTVVPKAPVGLGVG